MEEKIYMELEKTVSDMGGAFTGFSNIGGYLPEGLKKYPYAVTFGIRLSDAIIDEIEDKPTYTYFNHYRSVNALIDQIALRIVLALNKKGFKGYSIAASQSIPASPVPFSGVIPHKTGAIHAGLGWIGRSGLFIHKDFGPRVRLGTVLTDVELPCPETIMESKCSNCSRCVGACPAYAITGNEWSLGEQREYVVDAKACSEYMNQKFKHIGRGSVCGICIKVCPHKKADKRQG